MTSMSPVSAGDSTGAMPLSSPMVATSDGLVLATTATSGCSRTSHSTRAPLSVAVLALNTTRSSVAASAVACGVDSSHRGARSARLAAIATMATPTASQRRSTAASAASTASATA